MYFLYFGRKDGSATFIPIAMLTAAISTFLFVTNASLGRRHKQLIEVEKKYYISQLEQKLKGALRDPSFFRDAFVKKNQENNHNYVISTVDDIDSKWIGHGSKLSFPSLEPCTSGPDCLIKSNLKVQPLLINKLAYLKFIITFDSLKPVITGHFNPNKRNSRAEVIVPAGYHGLALKNSSLFCEKGFGVHFVSSPPLEVLCRPL